MSIYYRSATLDDAQLIFDWINEKEVRENSLSPNLIHWENHLKWFESKIQSKEVIMFLFYQDEIPIGQVRLDFKDPYWVINFLVDKKFRGKGFGKMFLKTIIEETSFRPLFGVVKKSNIKSYKIFQSLGFVSIGTKDLNGSELVEFELY